MQTFQGTDYNITVTDTSGNQLAFLDLSSTGGMTDTAALALVDTLRNFAWPSAMAPVTVYATKSESNVTTTQCSASTTPPTFS
jgi:hypothetical protein